MKLLHAADFHLDAPYAALSPEKAALRRGEGRALLGRLAQLAREERVDLVLLAGDLFDGAQVYRETLTALREALASIPAPVFIAPGNHDPYTAQSPYETMDWPDNVSIFTREELTPRPMPELGVVVHGAAFCSGTMTRDLLAEFHAPEDGLMHIGLVHGDLGGAPSAYHPIAEESVAASGLRYLALGHIHAPSGLQTCGETYWAYPGSVEGHGFDELGERGCLIVEVDDQSVKADFHPLGERCYREVRLDVTGKSVEEAARRALALQEPGDCCKLILTGETDETVNCGLLEQKLGSLVFALRVKDGTRPCLDLEKLEREETLTGAFLRCLAREEAGGDQRELALRFGLAALGRGEDCCP